MLKIVLYPAMKNILSIPVRICQSFFFFLDNTITLTINTNAGMSYQAAIS